MIQLYDWQKEAAETQVRLLRTKRLAINASSTGLGKTFMTAWSLKELDTPAFVVCPKSVITNWNRVLDNAGVEKEGVINWEALKTGKHPWWDGDRWRFNRQLSVVIDEFHRGASGANSKCTYMLGQLRIYPSIPRVLLSATVATTPLALRGAGYLAGLHDFNDGSFYSWCRSLGCVNQRMPNGSFATTMPIGKEAGEQVMLKLRSALEQYMIRLTPDEAPGFPETEVVSKLFTLDQISEAGVRREYEEMAEAIRDKSTRREALITRARQRAEICKVPILAELAKDLVQEGRSVVIFVNYRQTISLLELALGSSNIVKIWGEQGITEREDERSLFQTNVRHICLAQCQAGGLGIDLHDELHARPRTSLLSPSYNAADMVQCLGRVHRAGGTKSVQYFVLLAGTIEENVHRAILRKRHNLRTLTDGELLGTE